MKGYFGSFQIGRILILRSLAGIYIIAFISALNQFPALLGENGFLPVADFIKHASFKQSPSLFYLYYSDIFFISLTWVGILLSTIALIGLSEK